MDPNAFFMPMTYDQLTLAAFLAANPQIAQTMFAMRAAIQNAAPLPNLGTGLYTNAAGPSTFARPGLFTNAAQLPFSQPGLLPNFAQMPLPGPALYGNAAGPSWGSHMQPSTSRYPSGVTIKAEPKEAPVVNQSTAGKVPVVKFGNGTKATVRSENPLWERLWSRNWPASAPVQPFPFAQAASVNRNVFPGFMPAPTTLTPPLSPDYGSDSSVATRKVSDIPRYEIERDIDLMMAKEVQDILSINDQDSDELERDNVESMEHRSFFKYIKKASVRPEYPLYKKQFHRKRGTKSAMDISKAIAKKIKLEKEALDLSPASGLSFTSDNDSSTDMNESCNDNIEWEETVVGDANYNVAAAPENETIAAIRNMREKLLENAREKRLTKFDVDLSKVEYNASMVRQYPKVHRSEKEQKKREQNSKAARICRFRHKAEEMVDKELAKQIYIKNIEKMRFIACANAYIKKLMELQNKQPEDLQKTFYDVVLKIEQSHEAPPQKEITPDPPAVKNEEN